MLISQKDLYSLQVHNVRPLQLLKCTFSHHLNSHRQPSQHNDSKVAALARFFPPPPSMSHVLPGHEYPPPLKGPCCSSWSRIHQVIRFLSPSKVSGPDEIPNVILIKCCDALIDHLYFIFRDVFWIKTYHPRWLESITLMLCKISKKSYDIVKSYWPIGLIDTIPKVFLTLCSKHISFLAEKHNLLPKSRLCGRLGRNMTDTMLLITHNVKDS